MVRHAAPKGTPPAVIARLNREINAALADPDMRAKLANLGGVPIAGTPEQFWAIHRMETEKWAKSSSSRERRRSRLPRP